MEFQLESNLLKLMIEKAFTQNTSCKCTLQQMLLSIAGKHMCGKSGKVQYITRPGVKLCGIRGILSLGVRIFDSWCTPALADSPSRAVYYDTLPLPLATGEFGCQNQAVQKGNFPLGHDVKTRTCGKLLMFRIFPSCSCLQFPAIKVLAGYCILSDTLLSVVSNTNQMNKH